MAFIKSATSPKDSTEMATPLKKSSGILWTHPDPEGLLRRFAGKGISHRSHPGVPGYKETVDFGEIIGIWKNKNGSDSR